MENKDGVGDNITSPQKPAESCQDELHKQRLKRQLHQARVCSKKQNLGHTPRVAPPEQDLDTGLSNQAGQTIKNTTAAAGEQRRSKKGQNPRSQPPSLGTRSASQPISARYPPRFPECFRYPEIQQAFANGPEHLLRGAHDQETALERLARAERRIAMAVHNVADPCLPPPNIRDLRIHPRPTSLNSQCGTVLANEHDYFVKEYGSHDDNEWDRCLSPPNFRDDRTHSRPTSLNSQCGTVLANEHDYFVKEERSHDDGEWDRCEMSSSEED